MFTGLVRTQGTIRRIEQRGDCVMTLAMAEPFAVAIGDSIAINGICLTATNIDGNAFDVSLSAETLQRTTAKDWAVGTLVNLEPALALGDAMGGHFVSGHIDSVAKAIAAKPSGDSTIWQFEVPSSLARFIAPKGSVTLDGVSLTINDVADQNSVTHFTVNIIPHTANVTSFGQLKVGSLVNLEIDMLARYVARLAEAKCA